MFAAVPPGMESNGMGFGFSPEPNLGNLLLSLQLLEPQFHHLQQGGNHSDSVSFTYRHEDQMQSRLKHFINYKALSTHKLLNSTGNTFLLVGREASELWERQIGISGVH